MYMMPLKGGKILGLISFDAGSPAVWYFTHVLKRA